MNADPVMCGRDVRHLGGRTRHVAGDAIVGKRQRVAQCEALGAGGGLVALDAFLSHPDRIGTTLRPGMRIVAGDAAQC
jgi:hypothetical protein